MRHEHRTVAVDDEYETQLVPRVPLQAIDLAAKDTVARVTRNRAKHSVLHRPPPQNYAIILEEMDEYWDEVKAYDYARQREELLDVAAACLQAIACLDAWELPEEARKNGWVGDTPTLFGAADNTYDEW